jgi:integrase
MPRKPRRRTWGTGSLAERDGRWWIRWRENGRRMAKSFASKDLAEEVLAKITRDVAAGDAGLRPDYRETPNLETLAKTWLERRQATHRSCRDDRSRWKTHLGPSFGRMKPHEVNAASLRRFVEDKLAKGLAANTVGNLVRQMSTFFADIVEQGHAPANPVGALPRSTRRLYRPGHDSRTTAFIEKMADIERVFRNLPSPVNVAFAVGAFAGLRTGEVLGLHWRDVDLDNRRLHIRQQVNRGRLGPLKDDDSRVVPILTPLLPVLAEWKLATGGEGLLFPPVHPLRGGRPETPSEFTRPQTFAGHLRKAVKKCNLPALTWYQATRHTFASQFVLGGGSIEKLSKILGHASVTTTERYSHLRADLFRQSDYEVMPADLSTPAGNVVSLRDVSSPNGHTMGTAQEDGTEQKLAEAS